MTDLTEEMTKLQDSLVWMASLNDKVRELQASLEEPKLVINLLISQGFRSFTCDQGDRLYAGTSADGDGEPAPASGRGDIGGATKRMGRMGKREKSRHEAKFVPYSIPY